MKLAVFDDYRIGIVEGAWVYDVTPVVPEGLRALRVHMNWLVGNWDSALPEVLRIRRAAGAVALSAVRLRPPSPCPSHVFGVRENGFSLKPPGSLAGPADGIRLPQGSTQRFDHEPELAVIIGRRARNVPRSEAMGYVFGYSCLVGARMRESSEAFTALGPYIVTADEVRDPQALDIRLWVNGKLRQEAHTRDMTRDIAELIALISAVLPLNPGDVVASGTPGGVGPANPGDRVKIAIDRVGEMTLAVTEQPGRSPSP